MMLRKMGASPLLSVSRQSWVVAVVCESSG